MNTRIIMNVLTICAGIYLIVAPQRKYDMEEKEKQSSVPKYAKLASRIIGVVCVLVGLAFLYFELTRG